MSLFSMLQIFLKGKTSVVSTISVKISSRLQMTEELNNLCPPLAVRGMTVLDREAFTRSATVVGAIVPIDQFQSFLKHFKKQQVHKVGLKPVTNVPTTKINPQWKKVHKLVLLQPGTIVTEVEKMKFKLPEDLIEHAITLTYNNFIPSEVFEAVLPSDMPNLSAYTEVGHIIHVNLREHQMPYKKLIGQVLLDKVAQAKTVVHKCNTIDNEFRTFEFELLGGEPHYVTRVVEYQRRFDFDFSKVFWNSRLGTEHRRLAEFINKTCTVFDVFAGVGPFAVPLARKGCTVFANDLNPESFKWLQHNAKLNKTQINCFNMDGRDFLKVELHKSEAGKEIHIVMNLPEIAIEFLDVFKNLIERNNESSEISNQIEFLHKCHICVHCYTFSPATEGEELMGQRFEKHFGQPIPKDCNIHFVRRVSPSKHMYCLSFDLTMDVLVENAEESKEPENKRLKL